MTSGYEERSRSIRSDVRIALDKRIVHEAGIFRRVRNHHPVVGLDRVRAESLIAWGRLELDPATRFDPLQICSHQSDERYWRVTGFGGLSDERFQNRIRIAVESLERLQGFQSGSLDPLTFSIAGQVASP
jgi:hypothetical protein